MRGITFALWSLLFLYAAANAEKESTIRFGGRITFACLVASAACMIFGW